MIYIKKNFIPLISSVMMRVMYTIPRIYRNGIGIFKFLFTFDFNVVFPIALHYNSLKQIDKKTTVCAYIVYR